MHKEIRVLEVIRQGQIGGGESHLLDLVECLDKSKVFPIVLSFSPGHMIDLLRKRGVKCYVIDSQKPFDWSVQKLVSKVLKTEQVDLVHAHGSRAASNVLQPVRKLHIPLVYTVHGWSFHSDQSWFVRKLRMRSEKWICFCSRQVICVSETNQMTGVESFGLRNSVVIENGVNLKRFDPAMTYPTLRREWGMSEKDFVVAQICRITAQKAPLDFLKAIELAHKADPAVKGLLIGEGDMEQSVKDYISSHRMEDYLVVSPFRTDVPAVLAALDVFVLPSLWEGLSIALLEAMAMRKPIVATPTDGTRELIVDGEHGTIVPFGNPQAISDAILRYRKQPDEMLRHGLAACRVVENRYNAQRVADAVLSIYNKVYNSTPCRK